jgi:hypothetical protein
MAKFKIEKIVFEKGALDKFIQENKDIKNLLMDLANNVKREAEATASDAENGPGGKITGYASAGFTVKYEKRSKRPVVKIISNADGETATAAHFNSQRKNGIGHLRAALYKYSTTKRVKKYPVGKPYSSQF